jgi:hypothetical protein
VTRRIRQACHFLILGNRALDRIKYAKAAIELAVADLSPIDRMIVLSAVLREAMADQKAGREEIMDQVGRLVKPKKRRPAAWLRPAFGRMSID